VGRAHGRNLWRTTFVRGAFLFSTYTTEAVAVGWSSAIARGAIAKASGTTTAIRTAATTVI
jgi:hypothetical protein